MGRTGAFWKAGVAAILIAAVTASTVGASAAAASATHHSRGHVYLVKRHRHRHRHRHRRHERNPFGPRLRAWLAARSDQVGAAVEDLRTGKTFVYHPGLRFQTASIVKVDILETLLHQRQNSGGLTSSEYAIAQGMIEHSDNNDATNLWNAVGGAPGVAAYNRRAGLTQTTPNVAWGLTTTTPLDQIRLLRQIVLHPSLLTKGAQLYELSLMSHVESDQRWGVSGGVPSSASIALKNGWLPVGGGWQINSVGRIKGDDRDYLIAVMTSGDPGEGYGIGTIQGISAIVFRELAEREAGQWGSGSPSTTASVRAAAARAARAGERYRAARVSG
jgi:beta-lactamase class A